MQIFERLKYILQDIAKPFVIEIGACDGYHSNLILQEIKSKDRPFIFHCLEPNTDLHPQILSNIHGHLMFNAGVIGVFPHAVGASEGETTFHVSYGQKISAFGEVLDHYYGSSSILKPKQVLENYPQMKFKEEKVFITTLDGHLAKYDLSNKPIDFIWMDVQGAELAVFSGAANALKNVRYIYTEYSNNEDYEGQGNLNDILTALRGFEVVEDYGGDVLLKNVNL